LTIPFNEDDVRAALDEAWSLDTSVQWSAQNPANGQCKQLQLQFKPRKIRRRLILTCGFWFRSRRVRVRKAECRRTT